MFAEELSTFLLYMSLVGHQPSSEIPFRLRLQMVALVAGFVVNDIYVTLWTGLSLTLLVMLLVVPAWPIFNKHPQRWLGSSMLPAGGIVVGGKKLQ